MNINLSLPVYEHRNEILSALKTNKCIIVQSPTGSGKTTQIPLILKEAGYDEKGVIGITQPRRIATLNVCEFINSQIKDEKRDESYCAYKMRFYDTSTSQTRIKILTDGMLLQEIQTDSTLSKYSVIMVDEAHERSLNIDFILGLLKNLLKTRNDLKVIISSATINTAAFSEFFDNAPIIDIKTKTYPVEVKYLTEEPESEDEIYDIITDILNRHIKHKTDTLVFLPGEAEIKECINRIYMNCNYNAMQIYPLYGRLGKDEQNLVFTPTAKNKMKVVVATNIAETSITIDKIKVVIDSGLEKTNYYNQGNYTSSLIKTRVSKSSADQRKGRSGRTGSGICYRLYTKKDFDQREKYTEEEILHTDLSEVVLRLSVLGIKDYENFPFITAPDREALLSGEKTLHLLNALDKNRNLTSVGKQMAIFPVLPRLAKCITECIREDISVLAYVITCVAFLSARSPYILPMGQEEEARKAHKRYWANNGDFISILFLLKDYEALETKQKKESFATRNFLDSLVLDEIVHIKEQLIDIVRNMGIGVKENNEKITFYKSQRILKFMACGLIQYICSKSGSQSYSTSKTNDIFIHPGSNYYKKLPDYILCGEIVKTSKKYARCVSPLSEEIIKEISPDTFYLLRKKMKNNVRYGKRR